MDLSRYRPGDATPNAILTAMAAAQLDVAGLNDRIDDAKAARDAALLDATPKDLRSAEDALALVRADAERLDAIVRQLGVRHLQAVEDTAVAKVSQAAAERSKANKKMSDFARDHGEQFIEMLETGWALHQDRQSASFNLKRAQAAVIEHHPARGDQVALPTGIEPFTDDAETIASIFQEIGTIFSGTALHRAPTDRDTASATTTSVPSGKRGAIATVQRMIAGQA